MKRFMCALLALALLWVGGAAAETEQAALTGLVILPAGVDREALAELLNAAAAEADVCITWEEMASDA
ncbi:MAG: hypothetical protein IK099_01550 [Clostridia bacterium]|nr:hypothetical protein [Clostridia bacterium]